MLARRLVRAARPGLAASGALLILLILTGIGWLGLTPALAGVVRAPERPPEPSFSSLHLEAGRWWLVSYYGTAWPAAVSRAVYVDLLARRFRGSGLSVRTFASAAAASLADELLLHRPLSPAVIDEQGRIARQLGAGDGRDHVWLLDPRGAERFHAAGPLLDEGALRQVVEKALLGKVSAFVPGAASRLRAGDLLPDLQLLDVRTGQLVQLAEARGRRAARLVYFAADCTQCSLAGELDLLAELAASPRAPSPLLAIFSSRFAFSEIGSGAAARRLSLPVFIAAGPMSGIEDLYFLRHLIDAEVVIDADPQGRALSVSSLAAILHPKTGTLLPAGGVRSTSPSAQS